MSDWQPIETGQPLNLTDEEFVRTVTDELVRYFNGTDSRPVLDGEARQIALGALRRARSLRQHRD